MTNYDDPTDVVMRHSSAEQYDQTTERHLRIKTLLEQRKNALIDQLQDPTLTRAERRQLQAQKDEVKADIASIRVGGSELDYWRMQEKYR
ncbi:hypothetical protein KIMH_11250 [Bombiscardovia apis]|uniref:Uncharacterized protein n=1 Tax=Bombiscardovia apis TaxID=2932182 RepID=A0ABM8BDN5_9BIFI|nr:hypothetical protein [Bombiscardovia apis]BDR55014.1 hypothetical protein KIMH_11250 [Bombiscardovia apis]